MGPTRAQVTAYTGEAELAACLKGAELVVIPAGVPRKPGMTRDDLFNVNAGALAAQRSAAQAQRWGLQGAASRRNGEV
jgi:malate/lactate dehydrogenase